MILDVNTNLRNVLSYNVNFYRGPFPPIDRYHFYDIIKITNLRLNLFKILKTHERITIQKTKELLDTSPLAYLLTNEESEYVQEARKIDLLSHYMLRVLYCEKGEDFNVNFFRKLEIIWFLLRWESMVPEKQDNFLKLHNLTLDIIPRQEKKNNNIQDEGTWYKTHFTQVYKIVTSRNCLINNSQVLFSRTFLHLWIEQRFLENLSISIKHARHIASSLGDHLKSLLYCLKLVSPFEYSSNDNLNLQSLDENIVYFPLCMRLQYEALRKSHHLKYNARKQLGFFLKDAGLPLADALQFWQEELLKIKTEKMLRSYMYYIKHQYGVVGNKRYYSALDCIKIFMEPQIAAETSGCPFKYFSDLDMEQRLCDENIVIDKRKEILDLKRKGKFQQACGTFFGCNFKGCMETIHHGVEYFQKAQEYGLRDIEDLGLDRDN